MGIAHAQVLGIAQPCMINGAVHSKYTEEKSADSFCEPDSGKKDCGGCSSLRSLEVRESTVLQRECFIG